MDRDPCPTCGRPRAYLMSEFDVNPFERIAQSRMLLMAVCVLIVLGSVGLEAILR